MEEVTAAGTRLGISEIADYEVRRELLLAGKSQSIARLDGLKREHVYVAITTPVMLVAAELWAQARRAARLSAGRHRLDGDVILAAQAILVQGQGHEVIVATENVRHLSRFVDARRWQDIPTTDG